MGGGERERELGTKRAISTVLAGTHQTAAISRADHHCGDGAMEGRKRKRCLGHTHSLLINLGVVVMGRGLRAIRAISHGLSLPLAGG